MRPEKKRTWKFAVRAPASNADRKRSGWKSWRPLAGKRPSFSAVVAALSAALSLLVAYRQAELQAGQNRLQAEQTRIAAIQALPELQLIQGFQGKDVFVQVCGVPAAMRSVSTFQTFFLPEFGRYQIPAPDDRMVRRIRVAITPQERVTWQMQGGAPTKRSRKGEAASSDLQCAMAKQPSIMQSAAKFLEVNNKPGAKVGYWWRYEALILIEQRDRAGNVYPRHYLFTHDRSDEPELLSDAEGKEWVASYERARKEGYQVVMGNETTDFAPLHEFFAMSTKASANSAPKLTWVWRWLWR